MVEYSSMLVNSFVIEGLDDKSSISIVERLVLSSQFKSSEVYGTSGVISCNSPCTTSLIFSATFLFPLCKRNTLLKFYSYFIPSSFFYFNNRIFHLKCCHSILHSKYHHSHLQFLHNRMLLRECY